MSLVAVHGLGVGDDDVVTNATTTCMPNEKWAARMESYNLAMDELSKAKAQRWHFLIGGVLFGVAAGVILGRAR